MNNGTGESSLKNRISTAEQAATSIRDGMTVAMSGYAMAGYPKAVVEALVQRKQSGEELSFGLITGANVPWLDETLGAEKLVTRRAPMVASRTLAAQANNGSLSYVEQQMSKMPRLLRSGSFGRIDVAVVEALGFDENGDGIQSIIVPTSGGPNSTYARLTQDPNGTGDLTPSSGSNVIRFQRQNGRHHRRWIGHRSGHCRPAGPGGNRPGIVRTKAG